LRERGHDVPAHAPSGQMIERSQLPREVVGFDEVGVHRGDQPDVLGLPRESGHQGERLEGAASRPALDKSEIVAELAYEVREEGEIELAALERLHDFRVLVEIRVAALLDVRSAPGVPVRAVALNEHG